MSNRNSIIFCSRLSVGRILQRDYLRSSNSDWTNRGNGSAFGVIDLVAAGAGAIEITADFKQLVRVLCLDGFAALVGDIDNVARLHLPIVLVFREVGSFLQELHGFDHRDGGVIELRP